MITVAQSVFCWISFYLIMILIAKTCAVVAVRRSLVETETKLPQIQLSLIGEQHLKNKYNSSDPFIIRGFYSLPHFLVDTLYLYFDDGVDAALLSSIVIANHLDIDIWWQEHSWFWCIIISSSINSIIINMFPSFSPKRPPHNSSIHFWIHYNLNDVQGKNEDKDLKVQLRSQNV